MSRSPRASNHQLGSVHYTVLVVILLIMIAAAAMLFVNLFPVQIAARTYESGYRDGFVKARELAAAVTGVARKEHPIISGTITAVLDNKVQFQTTGLIVDQAIDGVGMKRTARTTSATRIILMQPIPQDEYARRLEDYENFVRNNPDSASGLTRPSRIIEQPIMLSELRIGDTISVQDFKGQDLFFKDSFDAGLIILHRADEATFAPTGIE